MFYFLRWLCGWGLLVEGVCEILSLGYWQPDISYKVETVFLDWCENHRLGLNGKSKKI
jgi:hypothetical protein